jgi:hypothetical protein
MFRHSLRFVLVALFEELAVWRGAGILGNDQAAQIESLYETRGQSTQRRVSRAMFTLMGVAAFLVGLAVLLLIGYNWDGMPRPVPQRIGWGFSVNGAYTLPLLILPGMLWAYNKRSPLAIALYVPLAVWWVVLQPVAWQATERSVYLVGAVGAALLLLAETHHPGDPMGAPFRFWGTAVSAGVLVPLGFAEFIRELQFPHGSGVVTGLTILIFADRKFALLRRTRQGKQGRQPISRACRQSRNDGNLIGHTAVVPA